MPWFSKGQTKTGLHKALPFSCLIQKFMERHIRLGTLLERGPGWTWPALALLAKEPDLKMIGLGYAEVEARAAQAAASQRGLGRRALYRPSLSGRLPLADASVEAAVCFAGWKQWAQPLKVLDEIQRVVKSGWMIFLGDFQRDLGWLATFLLGVQHSAVSEIFATRQQALSSAEIQALLSYSHLGGWTTLQSGPEVWLIAERP
jgi:hypothetical protein